MSSAAIITSPTMTVADRMKIQRDKIARGDYIVAGKLLTIVLEKQMPLGNLSQSLPRWASAEQQKMFAEAGSSMDALAPMSEAQTVLWTKITLDWLHHSKAPLLAISKDHKDILLPQGVFALPDLPDPTWTPKQAGDVAPRIPQRWEDRACGKITRKDGRMFLVFQPVQQLCIMLGGALGGFGTIHGITDPADRTHLAFLVDVQKMHGFFVGGRFTFGA